MRKILLTLNAYPKGHFMNSLFFFEGIKDNFEKYCSLNDFELMVIEHNVAYPLHIHWSKIKWILENWDKFNEGDVITYIDSDSIIMNFNHNFVFEKPFTIPIESTGLLSMGFFSIRICEFVKDFLNKMISFEPVCNKSFNDNHALYLALGVDFGDNNFQNENIQILPNNYNVTIIPDELIDGNDNVETILRQYYKPEIAVSKDEMIIRHFSAGQIYKPYVKNYLHG